VVPKKPTLLEEVGAVQSLKVAKSGWFGLKEGGGQIAQNRSKSDDNFVDSVRSRDFFNAGLSPHPHTTTSHELKIGHPPGFLLF